MSTVAEFFGVCLRSPGLATADVPYVGTEYEIEAVRNITWNDYLASTFTVENDGSLRNNGKEFISVPLTRDASIVAFSTLHNALQLGPEDPYTFRTSTHVHLNVASLTIEQLKHLMLLYALLEPFFFHFAGESRKKNIHCVPLSYTMMPKLYRLEMKDILPSWAKYSAFNMKPVTEQGTVEFRHLFGTGNVSVYADWLGFICEFWMFVKHYPVTWLYNKLSTGTPVLEILKQVIPSSMLVNGVTEGMFEESTIDVKLAYTY